MGRNLVLLPVELPELVWRWVTFSVVPQLSHEIHGMSHDIQEFVRKVLGAVAYWSGQEDSNLRSPAPKAGALPLRHAQTLYGGWPGGTRTRDLPVMSRLLCH